MVEVGKWDTVNGIVCELNRLLAVGDSDGASGLFDQDCFWRDLLVLTWTLRTLHGRDEIRAMLDECVSKNGPLKIEISGGSAICDFDGALEAVLEVSTKVGRGSGIIRIRNGKIFTLFTALNELKGFEEKEGHRRKLGTMHGVHRNRTTWREDLEEEFANLGRTRQPYCLVIGGGQGGIVLGARLRQLDVPTIVIDRHSRPGDNWRKRYKSLCLHDPVWYDHLPYMPFPKNWPIFSPKDKIADWLEMYTKIMEVNYWSNTECVTATFNSETSNWTVVLNREGEEVVLHPRHIVIATGLAGKPSIPAFRGDELFEGDLHHSSRHPGPDGYAGKRVIVVGSNNSAHDICAALWEVGADVTMVQRSSTHIVRSGRSAGIGERSLYSQEAEQAGISTDLADLIDASIPYALLPRYEIPHWQKIKSAEAEYYRGLESAGFKLDFGEDGSGIALKYLRRAAGYYIDVGASQLIIDGKVKLKSDSQISGFSKSGVIFEDGTELRADAIILATGFQSMNGWIADLISQKVADRLGPVWGLGSGTKGDPGPWEGELRNMWKPTPQEGLWIQGGNLHQTRYYSQFLALQLKARMEGVPISVYRSSH